MHGVSAARYDNPMAMPLPPSSGPMDYDECVGAKWRCTVPGSGSIPMPGSSMDSAVSGSSLKKGSRVRSDSAPLGYGLTN